MGQGVGSDLFLKYLMEAGPGSKEIKRESGCRPRAWCGEGRGSGSPGSWTELGWRLVITIHFDPGFFGAVGLYLKIG